MQADYVERLKARVEVAALRFRHATQVVFSALSSAWRGLRPPLVFVLQVIAALILIFEEWGWQPLVDALGRLARWRPWAALEARIQALPPYGALATLALPTLTLLPLKFVALYLAANGQVLTAGCLFIGAKLASTALIGRFFLLTRPRLMQISWFASIYEFVLPWQQAMFAMIRQSWPWRYGRMVKNTIRHETKRAWARWRPAILDRLAALRLWSRIKWEELKPRLTDAARRLKGLFQGTRCL